MEFENYRARVEHQKVEPIQSRPQFPWAEKKAPLGGLVSFQTEGVSLRNSDKDLGYSLDLQGL